MLRRSWRGVALAALVVPLAGCRWLVTQTISEVKGADAVVHPIVMPSREALARINSVEFAPSTAETSDTLVPAGVLRAYDRAAQEALTKQPTYDLPGGPPSLTIRTALWYFQAKGVFSGAEAIGRIRMYDGDRMIGDAVVRGESESFRVGEGLMAEAMVKSIMRFLQKQRGKTPEP